MTDESSGRRRRSFLFAFLLWFSFSIFPSIQPSIHMFVYLSIYLERRDGLISLRAGYENLTAPHEQVVQIRTIPGHLAGSLRGVPESSGDSDHASKLQSFFLQLYCPLHMLSLPSSLSLSCYGGDGRGRDAPGGSCYGRETRLSLSY